MITSTQLKTLFYFSALIAALILWKEGHSLPASWDAVKPFLNVPGPLLLILLAFEKWLWRIPYLHPWLVPVPDLSGTWEGTLKSNWIDPQTQQPRSPFKGYLVVNQTFSTVNMSLITEKSISELHGGNILKKLDGTFYFSGTYKNTPKFSEQPNSPIHNGGLILSVFGSTPYGLDGHYWTDRDTQGEISFEKRDSEKHYNFKEAESGEYIKYVAKRRSWWEFYKSPLDYDPSTPDADIRKKSDEKKSFFFLMVLGLILFILGILSGNNIKSLIAMFWSWIMKFFHGA